VDYDDLAEVLYVPAQGDAHPLKAIGIVATIIVFGSAMLVNEGWAYDRLGLIQASQKSQLFCQYF
jgi:hypothetical protein